MTTYTTNLEIPHLDQNVAQPEIPENVAKDIIDSIFSGKYTTALADADYTYPYVADPLQATPWHSYVQEFTGTLTAPRTVTLPDNSRPYILMNNTDNTLNFDISSGSSPVVMLPTTNVYVYSDGLSLTKIVFS